MKRLIFVFSCGVLVSPADATVVFHNTGSVTNIESYERIYTIGTFQYSKAAGARQPIFVVDFLSDNPSSLSLISDGRAKYYIVRVPTGEIVESNDGGFGVRAVTDRTVNAKRQVVLHGDSDSDPFYLPYAPYGLVRTLVDYWGTTYLGVSLRAGEAVSYDITVSQITAVPEPASWAMMIAGFAMAGCAARRSRNPTTRNHRKLNQTTRHELL